MYYLLDAVSAPKREVSLFQRKREVEEENRLTGNEGSAADVQRFYDRVGSLYDWAERFEGRAKAIALDRFTIGRGQRVLNVGSGTGIDHQALARHVGSTGMAIAVDMSAVMLDLVRQRTGQPVIRADARELPFLDQTFDGIFCSYVLDLIPTADLGATVREFHRVVKPDGRIALLTLTEGVTPLSKALVALWKGVYAVSPIACGGCRPVELVPLVRQAGFHQVTREVVVEAGFPSQVIFATR